MLELNHGFTVLPLFPKNRRGSQIFSDIRRPGFLYLWFLPQLGGKLGLNAYRIFYDNTYRRARDSFVTRIQFHLTTAMSRDPASRINGGDPFVAALPENSIIDVDLFAI